MKHNHNGTTRPDSPADWVEAYEDLLRLTDPENAQAVSVNKISDVL